MEVCRILKVSELSEINFDALGIHWTTKPEKCTQQINPDNEPSLWLYAEINESDESIIWNDHTSADHTYYPGLEENRHLGEFEVTLRPGSKITILDIYDEDQESIAQNLDASV